ncbi:hypothetical protein [Sedimentibacter sp.]|uniref:hypothetical protein n=1 Tax=Sedimentibacter sp. TaxID=1960295 RepID=UPI0028A5EB0B|nr:hypothetical protein [Sedimentibacter sp.]
MIKDKRNNMEKRYEYEMRNFNPITINKLDCVDCDYVYDEPNLVSICVQYADMKPGKVLYGKKCDKHSRNINIIK